MARKSSDRVSITTAPEPASRDLTHRQHQYLVLMGLRLLCFGLVFVVPGVFKFVMLGAAVVLPAAAVLLANNSDRRTHVPAAEPDESLPAVTSHHRDDVVPGHVISEG